MNKQNPKEIEHLRQTYGSETVLTDPLRTRAYARDWRKLMTGRPIAVFRPETLDIAAALVLFCVHHRLDMIPQGGQTGLCGGAMPDNSATQVVFSLDRMTHIRQIDPDNQTMTVEAGCTLAQVQQAATKADRLFPLSLASEGSCQIGGTIATNAGGIHVLRYGMMRDLVMGLEAILPDGTIWSGLKGLRKDNTGYDLKQIFIGTEGTLGLITAATLKLFPKPIDRTVILCGVTSPEAALRTFHAMQRSFHGRLVAAELICRLGLAFTLKHIPETQDPFRHTHPWYILFEIEHHIADGLNAATVCCESASFILTAIDGVSDAVFSQSESQAHALWKLRESLSEAQTFEGGSIKHDISVPVSAVPSFLNHTLAAMTAWMPGIRPIPFGHIGDGNIHFNLSQPVGMDKEYFLSTWPEANRLVHDHVLSLNGSISAEHGIGRLKRTELARVTPDIDLNILRRIKTSLDPLNLMNPGALF